MALINNEKSINKKNNEINIDLSTQVKRFTTICFFRFRQKYQNLIIFGTFFRRSRSRKRRRKNLFLTRRRFRQSATPLSLKSFDAKARFQMVTLNRKAYPISSCGDHVFLALLPRTIFALKMSHENRVRNFRENL